MVNERIVVGDHGTTFGGNPLGTRLAHYVVSRLSEPKLQAGVLVKSKIFMKHFEELQKKYPELVKEIRGRGLHLGLQLTQDPTPIVAAARERGLLVITAGTNTLRFDEAMHFIVTLGEEPAGKQANGEVDSPN
jgi:acetylornithine aminotransferase